MKKLLILGLAILFAGCETTKDEGLLPFNAMLGAGGHLEYREDFLKINRTYGAIYKNEDGDIVEDLTSPRFRTFIITEIAQMDEIFSVYPDINFEKDMIVVHFYTSSIGREIIITNITLNNKNLKISFKYSKGKTGYADASSPQTRFLVLKLDKLDIDMIEFKLLNLRG